MVLGTAALQARSCASLVQQDSSTVSIVSAQVSDTRSFDPPGHADAPEPPMFCRVVAQLRPSADSEIGSEIWLPLTGWNGKLLAVGSGGWGGSINVGGMLEALRRGYATSATDDGHTGPGASFIMGHPERFVDFAYRAEHETTVIAKALIEAFYGHEARYAYWNGCSGGGREGLLQAHRYPDEFDGIVAGDAANLRRNSWMLWLAAHTAQDPASYIPPEKLPMIHRTVLDACDAADGLKDGLIGEPERCKVDFETLKCVGADGAACLTAAQIQTAVTVLKPVMTPAGKVLLPGLEPGSELAWKYLAMGQRPADLFLDQFRYVVYQDPNWDWRNFDLPLDTAKLNAANHGIAAVDPDLRAFAKHGGKLLIYHGWADQQVAPGFSIEFYESARRLTATPAQSSNWIRLFMVPGMGHCGGGEGPDIFDKISAMEQWVEHGHAPARMLASHQTAGKVDRTRPLCPYPEVAWYRGRGTIDEASSFTCRRVPLHH
jgi:feruloyl esterase